MEWPLPGFHGMKVQRKMTLGRQETVAIDEFLEKAEFAASGAVITDLDGTAVHEDNGRIYIPQPVEYGLKALYERGRPVVLNSLRFPLSVMRTFGKEWLTISGAPIPVVSMNGSQLGFITRDEKEELCFEELKAFPLSPPEIDSVLTGVDALLDDNIREVLLFYYPRDWRMGEIIWTPVAEKVDHVKEKYTSASSVVAVKPEKLSELLHAEEICMIFLLIERPADDLMAYQHSRPSSFFTTKGVDKLSGSAAMAELLKFDLQDSIGSGDTQMDNFLDGVGLSIHVGPHELEFRGSLQTIRLANSFELGDALFYIADRQGRPVGEN
jgi:hydroxymethylpyrimidine pyrophosphatase-like HAD family hydrolase